MSKKERVIRQEKGRVEIRSESGKITGMVVNVIVIRIAWGKVMESLVYG